MMSLKIMTIPALTYQFSKSLFAITYYLNSYYNRLKIKIQLTLENICLVSFEFVNLYEEINYLI